MIKALLPVAQNISRRREVNLRQIVAIFYVLKQGCSWRALAHDLPPWQTDYNLDLVF